MGSDFKTKIVKEITLGEAGYFFEQKNNKDLMQKEIKAHVGFTNLIQKQLNLDPHKYLGPSVKCLTCFPTWANNRNVKQKLQNVLALLGAMCEILLKCMIYILKAIEKHKIKMKQLEIMFYNFWIEIGKKCQCDLG